MVSAQGGCTGAMLHGAAEEYARVGAEALALPPAAVRGTQFQHETRTKRSGNARNETINEAVAIGRSCGGACGGAGGAGGAEVGG